MLGMVTDSGELAVEDVVSSKMVVGVSGTEVGAGCASWYCRLLMLESVRPSDRVEHDLNDVCDGNVDLNVVWLGRGVPRSGRICVQPSRKRSHSSQHAWTAEPSSS